MLSQEEVEALRKAVNFGLANINEEESDIKFERIRRITGYLVGTVDRFNDAKKAEVRDRVKHTEI